MELSKIYLTAWLAIMLLLATACTKKVEEDLAKKNQGEIYFKWAQSPAPAMSSFDLHASCKQPAGNYADDNPDVPLYAEANKFYGPCEPGIYQAQFYFYLNDPNSIMRFAYTLEKPADGYKRYYTKLTKAYDSGTNRCLNYSSSNISLTYYDEKK